MLTKLTLKLDDKLIGKAELYAFRNGKGLSELVESYLEELTCENNDHAETSLKLRTLVGAVKLPVDFNEDRELTAYFKGKHV